MDFLGKSQPGELKYKVTWQMAGENTVNSREFSNKVQATAFFKGKKNLRHRYVVLFEASINRKVWTRIDENYKL